MPVQLGQSRRRRASPTHFIPPRPAIDLFSRLLIKLGDKPEGAAGCSEKKKTDKACTLA